MENVYDRIEKFYLDHEGVKSTIEKTLVEGYLRQKAWQGLPDETLKDFWRYIALFIQYCTLNGLYDLHKITSQDYVEFALWLEDGEQGFSLTQENLMEFFNKMESFHRYLIKKNIISDMDLLQIAKEAFFIEGEFLLPVIKKEQDLLSAIKDNEMITDETAIELNFLLEKLLNRIGCYYKNERFSFDFNRAISLFSGPFNIVPEKDGEEFWLGFWDYFLFDYRLVKSDMTPLKFFYENKKNILSADEQRILDDLLHAKFTVFYIKRILNEYTVECVNLMTDEIIVLPTPDYGIQDYKKILLYGHVYAEGIVMLNYITSVQVSPNLRKRIKEEIFSQYKFFLSQQSKASLTDFFSRHAIVVRHIIDILIHLAKVNVSDPYLIENTLPSLAPEEIAEDEVTVILKDLAKRYKMSLFSTKLLLNMWYDFSQKNIKFVEDGSVIAVSIFMIFSTINGVSLVKQKSLLNKFETDETKLAKSCSQVVNILQLRLFDPRYLTEEGFVLSLYAF